MIVRFLLRSALVAIQGYLIDTPRSLGSLPQIMAQTVWGILRSGASGARSYGLVGPRSCGDWEHSSVRCSRYSSGSGNWLNTPDTLSPF